MHTHWKWIALAVGLVLTLIGWNVQRPGAPRLRRSVRGAESLSAAASSTAGSIASHEFLFVLRSDSTEPARIRFTSRATGRATVHLLSPGRVTALPLEPGRYALAAAQPRASALAVWPKRLQLKERHRGRTWALRLAHPGTLVVEAIPSDERLPAGLVFRARHAGGGEFSKELVDGAWRTACPTGRYECTLTGAHLAEPLRESIQVMPGRTAAVRFRLPRRPASLAATLHLLVDGAPAAATDVAEVVATWRGQRGLLRRGDDGVFTGRLAPSGPLVTAAPKCEVKGLTFADLEIEAVDPGPDTEHVRFEGHIQRQGESVTMRLLDDTGAPVVGDELDLSLWSRAGQMYPRRLRVVSGANGDFRVEYVRYPFVFFVRSQRPGFRYVPNGVETYEVKRRGIVVVRRQERHRVWLLPPTAPGLREALLRHWYEGALLDAMPLAMPSQRFEARWQSATRTLTREARQEYERSGRIPLEDLPAGRYRITLFVPHWGTANTDVDVSEDQPESEIVLPGRSSTTPWSRRLAVEDPTGFVVLDGYFSGPLVSETARFYRWLLRQGDGLGACAEVRADGRFELEHSNLANPVVTIVTADNDVYHVPKRDLAPGRPHRLADDPMDRAVQGRVRAKSVENLVVNLTTVRGAEQSHPDRLWPRPTELGERPVRPDGRFSITGVTPGVYVFSLAHLRYDSATRRHFSIIRSSLRLITIGDADVDLDEIDLSGAEAIPSDYD